MRPACNILVCQCRVWCTVSGMYARLLLGNQTTQWIQ